MPVNLAVIARGAGFADWALSLGIDRFDPTFDPTGVLLFNVSMSDLDNVGDEWFLSGEVGGLEESPRSRRAGVEELGGFGLIDATREQRRARRKS